MNSSWQNCHTRLTNVDGILRPHCHTASPDKLRLGMMEDTGHGVTPSLLQLATLLVLFVCTGCHNEPSLPPRLHRNEDLLSQLICLATCYILHSTEYRVQSTEFRVQRWKNFSPLLLGILTFAKILNFCKNFPRIFHQEVSLLYLTSHKNDSKVKSCKEIIRKIEKTYMYFCFHLLSFVNIYVLIIICYSSVSKKTLLMNIFISKETLGVPIMWVFSGSHL